VTHVGDQVFDYEMRLAPKGLGPQLEAALRAAAAGNLKAPPRVCEALRALVPVRLRQ
jgi:hypothetical protein